MDPSSTSNWKGLVTSLTFVLILFLFFLSRPSSWFLFHNHSHPHCIGHRGASWVFPENTLLAYRSAIEMGAQILEGDIRLTLDNRIIMMHDTTLDRTTNGSGIVRNTPWTGYVERIFTRWRTTLTNEPVPLLRQVLELLELYPRVSFLLDIKDDNDPVIMEHLVQELKPFSHLLDRLIIGVWDAHYFGLLKKLLPDAKSSFIGQRYSLAHPSDYDNYNLYFGYITSDDVYAIHARNRTVFSWTLNNEEEWGYAKDIGIDGIITDKVMECLNFFDTWVLI